MRMVRRALTIGCVSLAAGLACGDAAPDSLRGDYALRTLNGEPLPFDNNMLGCCVYLAGSLRLTADEYRIGITFRSMGGTESYTANEWGTYVATGTTVTFVADTFDLAPLLLSPGTVAGETITLGLGGEGPGAPDQFQARFVRN